MCFQFMNTIAGGVDFGKGIVELYSQLLNAKTKQGDKRRVIIDRFTEEYYSKKPNRNRQSSEENGKGLGSG